MIKCLMKERLLTVFLVLILVLILLVLGGCQGFGEQTNKFSGGLPGFGKKAESEFSSRLIGVELKTIPTSKEIRSGESFGITGLLKNNLEQPIEGRACLSDKVSDNFGGIPSGYCEDFSMDAADETGSQQLEVFKNTLFVYEVPFDFSDVDIKSHIFYNALTKGKVKNVCIKPSLLDNEECANEETFSGSALDFSSGPLIVSKVKKELSKQQNEMVMRLFVTLRSLSDAEIINPDFVKSADLEEFIKDNAIAIKADYAGLGEFVCDMDNRVKIIKASTEIECVGKFSITEVIESPVSIVMDYGVKETKNVGTFHLSPKNEGMI